MKTKLFQQQQKCENRSTHSKVMIEQWLKNILMWPCKKCPTYFYNFWYTNEGYLHEKHPRFLALDRFVCGLWPKQIFKRAEIQTLKCRLVGCMFESNCPHVERSTIDGMPSVGVFLRDTSPYLHKFRRKRGKTPNG